MAGRGRKKINVVSLRGVAIPLPQVNRDVVDTLESLMADARDGRIAGILYATVSPEGHLVTAWTGNAESHSMIAGAAILQRRITKAGDPS